MKKFLPLLLSLFTCSTQVSANMEYSGDVSLGHNNNISNAVSESDIFEDQFLTANFNAGKMWLPAVGKSIVLSGHLGTEQFQDSEGLNRYSYGASVSYTQRLGLGAYAPRVGVSLRGDKRNFDSDMRDGWLYRASLILEKRFLPELHSSASLTQEIRTADENKAIPYTPFADSDVFNQKNTEFSASLDYTLENGSVITGRYLYRDGEIDASTNPGSEFFLVSRGIAQDYKICNTCGNYVVYLVNASVQSIMLDWNFALGRDTSLNASIERRIADAEGGLTYTGSIYRVQLNRRF